MRTLTEEQFEKELYLRLKNSVLYFKDKEFRKRVRDENGVDIDHHAFGSFGSKKTTDYLVIPMESQEEHNYADQHRSEIAIKYLPLMINQLINYIVHLKEYIQHLEGEG